MCCFGVAAFYLYLSAREDKKSSAIALLISGIFAGLATGVKYPALLFFCVPIFLMTIATGNKKSQGVKDSLIFILGIFITFSPWLLKNYLQTGNPVYPIFNNLFAISNWSEFLNQRFYDTHHSTDFSLSAITTNLKNIFITHRQLFPCGFILSLLTQQVLQLVM